MAKQQQRINWQQKREELLRDIEDTQRAATLLPNTDMDQELEILKARVQSATLDTRRYRNYLKPERRTLSAIGQELESHLQRRRKRSTLVFFLSTLPTALIYIGMYFSLVPGTYYAANPPLYLVACGLILCTWIGWFLLALWLYRRVLTYVVFPFLEKYPSLTVSTRFAVGSLFILLTMNPLFQAAQFAGKTMTPSWGIFAQNLGMVLLAIGSGNLVTTVANSLSILTVLVTLFAVVRSKRRKKSA